MTTILITGGGGYIGSHAVKKMLKQGLKVVVLDNFSRGYHEPLQTLSQYGELKIVEGDLRNKEDIKKVFHATKIDAVMHFAALCLVDESVKKPELYFENNTVGTRNLVEVMLENDSNKLIFSSTCAVYGGNLKLPVDEMGETKPESPYGESKLRAEKIIREAASQGLKYVILRYFNVCGADKDGEIGDSKKPSELLVQNAVRGALDIQEFRLTCGKVDTPDGTPVRDYVDVEDLIEAHTKALEYLDSGGKSDIFNLGNGKGWSVKEIVEAVRKELGVTFSIGVGETRAGELSQVYANSGKIKSTMNWQPQKSLPESIQSLALWYKNKPNGYKF